MTSNILWQTLQGITYFDPYSNDGLRGHRVLLWFFLIVVCEGPTATLRYLVDPRHLENSLSLSFLPSPPSLSPPSLFHCDSPVSPLLQDVGTPQAQAGDSGSGGGCTSNFAINHRTFTMETVTGRQQHNPLCWPRPPSGWASHIVVQTTFILRLSFSTDMPSLPKKSYSRSPLPVVVVPLLLLLRYLRPFIQV